MKKIISFSLWGNNCDYIQGVFENIRLQKEIFPEWVCRFYVDKTVPKDVVEKIKNNNSEVIYKNELGSEGHGLFWRFEPILDKNVERFLSRDTDARLSYREYVCVQEWIESDKDFHLIRDHMAHKRVIHGGLWGAKSGVIPNYNELLTEFKKNFEQYKQTKYRGKFDYFDSDQIFLEKYIWEYAKKSHHSNIRFKVNKKTDEDYGFRVPLQNSKEFIGQKYSWNNIPYFHSI